VIPTSPASAGMQTRLFRGGFLLYGFWVVGLAKIGTARAADSARSVSVTQ
jgi:hypothetical protein